MNLESIVVPDGEILFDLYYLSETEADKYLRILQNDMQWEQHQITIFGRQLPVPRLSAWHGDPDARYTYSGLALEPHPWTAPLRQLKTRLEKNTQTHFNSVLLNRYRDGQDSMGWHSDDEGELGEQPTIASLSLGGTRRFLLKHKYRKELAPVELALGHGSLLIMRGQTQMYWKHQIPKNKRPVDARINLTFRRIVKQGASPAQR